MGLFDVSEEKKRAKEIRKEGKILRKWVLLSGLDKKQVDSFMEEFLACVEQGVNQQENYRSARAHMEAACSVINEILPEMRELSVDVCKAHLHNILDHLPFVYHDCLIRKDDLDYESTLNYMKQRVPVYKSEDRLMMQSELENIKAVFDDTILWSAPDFMALAYFLRHKEGEQLADLENSQRNSYIERVYKEEFWNENAGLLEQARVLDEVEKFATDMLAK